MASSTSSSSSIKDQINKLQAQLQMNGKMITEFRVVQNELIAERDKLVGVVKGLPELVEKMEKQVEVRLKIAKNEGKLSILKKLAFGEIEDNDAETRRLEEKVASLKRSLKDIEIPVVDL